ncbi:MAG TPA: BamA/TamA family outer membrane protein [Gemmatimonadales bacterium]|nr:BamA/TamA family outer membrane protein [Gemmatimonadales bacterium]
MIAVLGCSGLRLAVAQAVEEGLVVRQLRFSGNGSVETALLAAAIATTNSSWIARFPVIRSLGLGAKRHLSERSFRTDVERLKTFYRLKGFLDVLVDTTVVRTAKDVYITFHITENEPVRVRTFEITGLDTVPDGDKLTIDLPLRIGQPFDRPLLIASADTLAIRLQDRGYPEVRVLLGKREVNREEHTADLSLAVEAGVPSVIGEIHVEGTRTVDSSFVRAMLATAPGRKFNSGDIAQSQRNLYLSELFRFATVRLDTAHFVEGSGVVPLTIVVTEGPMHRARSSVGYGTNDCFRLGLGWTARNALGHGQIFDVSAQTSKVGVGAPTLVDGLRNSICSALKHDSIGSTKLNYTVATSFRRPVFLSPDNTITVALFAERRSEFAVYQREDVGGSLTLLRETRSRIPISLTYRLSYGRTEAKDVSFCAFFNACTEADITQLRQRRLLATITANAVRLRVNNPLDPSRGTALTTEVTNSSRLIGSSRFAQFTRFLGDGSFYRPVGQSVLALHFRAGAVLSPKLALSSAAANFVPPEQRFYAGGPNDVRGYTRNEMGPLVYVVGEEGVDPAGNVDQSKVRSAATGGNTLVVGNIELRVPSPFYRSWLRFAGFVDAGSVWERGGGPGSGPALRVTPGVGIRFLTPLGPARLDVAYNGYDVQPGRLYLIHPTGNLEQLQASYHPARRNSRWVFQFGVGQAF